MRNPTSKKKFQAHRLFSYFTALLFLLSGGHVWGQGQKEVLSADFSEFNQESNTEWKGNDDFPECNKIFPAVGMIKVGSSKSNGSLTTRQLDLTGNYTVEFDVKGWTNIEGYIKVTSSKGAEKEYVYSATSSSTTLDHAKLSFSDGAEGMTITISTSAQRAYIDNIVITNIGDGTPGTPDGPDPQVKPAGFMWGEQTESSIVLTQGDAFTPPAFSNPNSLTVSFDSDNKDVATVDDKGTISLAGGTGKATITATSEANGNYEAGRATYTITVRPDAAPTHTISWKGQSDWNGVTTGEPNISLTDGDYTISIVKNNGSSKPTVNANSNDCRAYAKATVTLTSTASNMAQIVFRISTQGMERMSTITPSTGSVTFQKEKETLTWTGSAKSVSFTVGDKADLSENNKEKAGQLCFNSVDITVEGAQTFGFTISDIGYATYYNDKAVRLPAGVQAGIITAIQGEMLTIDYLYNGDLAEHSTIPAHTGVLLKGNQGTYSCQAVPNTADAPGNNLLKGSVTDGMTVGGGKYYMLSCDENGGNKGFYWGAENGEAFNNAAYKAYLVIPQAMEVGRVALLLDGYATAVEASLSATGSPVTDVYSIDGRMVRRQTAASNALDGLQKGIYIINGKKYIVK